MANHKEQGMFPLEHTSSNLFKMKHSIASVPACSVYATGGGNAISDVKEKNNNP